jgi:hypothetical protein
MSLLTVNDAAENKIIIEKLREIMAGMDLFKKCPLFGILLFYSIL